jgi:hypothetical protein
MACGGRGQIDTFAPCGEDELTWETWGDPFFTTWCNSCHASSTPNRFGAPEETTFDSIDEVADWNARIRVRVLDAGNMPLGGGLSDAEESDLDAFLLCIADWQ